MLKSRAKILFSNLSLVGVVACTSSSFSGNQGGKAGPPGANPTVPATPSNVKTQTDNGTSPDNKNTDSNAASKFNGSMLVQSSLTDRSIWVVTTDGNVNKISLDSASGYPMKTWTGAIGTGPGHRTFVSEIGLLIGATGGTIYRVADDVPIAGKVQKLWAAPASDAADRICVTSFKSGGKAYIGAAYTAQRTNRKFVKIPIDTTSATGVDLTQAQVLDVGVGSNDPWGYSCFINQAKNQFWSTMHDTISGVDLNTFAAIPASAAPNGAVISSVPSLVTVDATAKSGIYAMGGDANGNVLSDTGNAFYTMAHDPKSDMVFLSATSGVRMTLIPDACFTQSGACTQPPFHFDLSDIGGIGPMASLNDGRIVGIARGDTSQVFILAVKQIANPAAGLNVIKIKDVPGNAYMYSDFTGSSLYAATVDQTFNLSSAQGYVPGKSVVGLTLTWVSDDGDNQPWRGLTMSVRCSATAAFEPIVTVANSGIAMPVTASSCKGAITEVEVKVEPNGNAPLFSKTKSVSISGGQI